MLCDPVCFRETVKPWRIIVNPYEEVLASTFRSEGKEDLLVPFMSLLTLHFTYVLASLTS
jgi:hypothetical protein